MIKFNRLIAKSLEEFSLKDEFDSLTEIYYILKSLNRRIGFLLAVGISSFPDYFHPEAKLNIWDFMTRRIFLYKII